MIDKRKNPPGGHYETFWSDFNETIAEKSKNLFKD